MLPRTDGAIEFYDLSRLCKSPTKIIPSPEVSEGSILELAQNPHNLDFVIVLTRGMPLMQLNNLSHSTRLRISLANCENPHVWKWLSSKD
jgi:hypothetical protein